MMRTRNNLSQLYVQTLAVVKREDKSVQNAALYCGPLSLQRVGVKGAAVQRAATSFDAVVTW